ncbi:hypothetical protein VTP01DRAFT_8239 [Rhizomucor pusillus]|uniref:uncharacterized protein n=1 Tax=Rhizomucor pusillus TaxID=4840 RepID=UPI0037427E4E
MQTPRCRMEEHALCVLDVSQRQYPISQFAFAFTILSNPAYLGKGSSRPCRSRFQAATLALVSEIINSFTKALVLFLRVQWVNQNTGSYAETTRQSRHNRNGNKRLGSCHDNEEQDFIKAFPTTDKPGKLKEFTYDAPPLKGDEVYIKLLACVEVGKNVKRYKKGDVVGYSYLRDCCLNCRQCISGNDIMCPDHVLYPEGNNNGFAHGVVCKEGFVYKIPDGFTPQEAAPLMCTGLTVFTALPQAKLLPTARIAVVGIGGLGHLALQFASAWGCHVTAISHTPNKKDECLTFGAHEFMVSKDFTPEYIEIASKFDLILDTVSIDLEWDTYLDLLDRTDLSS